MKTQGLGVWVRMLIVFAVVSALILLIGFGFERLLARDKDYGDGLKATADFAVAVTALVAIYEFRRHRQNKIERDEEKRKDMSLDFIKRWNARTDRHETADVLAALTDQGRSVKDKSDFLEDKKMRRALMHQINFFEELAIAYRKELLNPEIIQDFFTTIIRRWYEATEFYIEKRRSESKKQAKLYVNFAWLTRELVRARESDE